MENATLQTHLDTLAWSGATILFIILGSMLLGRLASKLAGYFKLSAIEQQKVYWGFLFASPWILGFVIFVLGPALASLYYSFTDYKLGETPNWVELDNYRVFLLGEGAYGRRFTEAMYNSFYYALIGVPLQIGTALIMALLLNQQLRGVRIFRLIFYLPVILAGGPAVLLVWRYMLTSNGGFINEALTGLSRQFFLVDWLYRLFIFSVEGFNGFYIGVARGDPIGPLKYALPALIGALVLLTFLRGQWSETRRSRAWNIAEILGVILMVVLFARGLIAVPIEPPLIYAGALLALLGAMISAWQHNVARARFGGYLALTVFAIGLIVLLLTGSNEHKTSYLPVILVAVLPIAVSLIGNWNRRKFTVMSVMATVLCVFILLHIAPAELGGGKLNILPQQLTLNTTLEQPDNLDYLEAYPANTLSPLWVYAAVVLVLGGLALANNRHSRAQRYTIYLTCAFFGLLAIGSILDGIRYFQAFETIARATESRNYHFSLFRDLTATFPDQSRVPLWMSNELWSKPSLILITMWSSGAGMLIFLAALKNVPKVFYEAAEVDGATRWQKFTKITLPMISPAMFYNIVIGVIAALQTFESIYIIQNEQTERSLASAAYFLFFRTFRELAIGQGAAASWILAAIIVLLTALQFRYSRWVNYEA